MIRILRGTAEVHYPDGDVQAVPVDIVTENSERRMVGVRIVSEGPLCGVTVLVDPNWFEHARRTGIALEDLRAEA